METTEKKKRGRPATGRIRDKRLTIAFTASELETVKKFQKKHETTISDFILNSIKKIEKST